MRNLFFIVLSFVVVTACSSNDEYQIGQKTTMEVNTQIDAGEVVLGENVKTIIKVKNTGTYPLILAEVKGSCSCTVADYPKDPIAPGKSIDIETKIETRALGKLVKDVRITANTEPSLTTVLISADVVSK